LKDFKLFVVAYHGSYQGGNQTQAKFIYFLEIEHGKDKTVLTFHDSLPLEFYDSILRETKGHHAFRVHPILVSFQFPSTLPTWRPCEVYMVL
jgi:hypothetical protein